MIVTRDQLRAARMLLRLSQDDLAGLSRVGVATIRRFENGQEIGILHLDALTGAIKNAGAVLIEADQEHGVGVALDVLAKLPRSTKARLARGATTPQASETKPRGRPRRSTSGATSKPKDP